MRVLTFPFFSRAFHNNTFVKFSYHDWLTKFYKAEIWFYLGFYYEKNNWMYTYFNYISWMIDNFVKTITLLLLWSLEILQETCNLCSAIVAHWIQSALCTIKEALITTLDSLLNEQKFLLTYISMTLLGLSKVFYPNSNIFWMFPQNGKTCQFVSKQGNIHKYLHIIHT